MVRGTASYSGPQLNTESALAGLKGAQSQFQRPYRPTEELYRQAFAPAETVAPGASEYAQSQLKERTGSEEFERLLGMKQRETVEGAETAMHPAVLAQSEMASRQKAYPYQAQAAGMIESADIKAEADLQKAILDAREGNLDSLRQLLGPLANAFADIVTGPDEDMAAEAYGVLLDILKRSSGAGAF